MRFLGHVWPQLVGLEALSDLELPISETICNQTESNADVALEDEVHLGHLLFLIIDYLVLLSYVELARHESESYVIEEVCIFCGINVEEPLELPEYILKEIDCHYLILDFVRQRLQKVFIRV